MPRPSTIAVILGLSGALGCSKTSRHQASPTGSEAGQGGGGGGTVIPDATAGAGANAGPPTNLGTAHGATTLWAGGKTFVCWLSSGTLRCTTPSPQREFIGGVCLLEGCGPPHAPLEIDLGSGAQVEQVVVGRLHACARLAGGGVKCWGLGGALGLGDAKDRSLPAELGDALPFLDFGTTQAVVELAAGPGGLHTCARFEDGTVRCWGSNLAGELGLGDGEPRGDQPGEMGEALPAVDLGAGEQAQALAVGMSSSCALLRGGKVKCWGMNDVGQLGLGDHRSRGKQAGEMGDALPSVDLGSGRSAVALSAGAAHYCAVLDDASSKCWGAGAALGSGTTDNLGDEPGEMGNALPALDLGTGFDSLRIVAGDRHSCAISSAGSLKCWGDNHASELGLGDDEPRGDEPGEMGNALPEVPLGSERLVSVALGDLFTCALFADESLACWGRWKVTPPPP